MTSTLNHTEHDQSSEWPSGVFDFPSPEPEQAVDDSYTDEPDERSWREKATDLRDRLTTTNPRRWLHREPEPTVDDDDDPEMAEFVARAQGTGPQRLKTNLLRGGLIAWPVWITIMVLHSGSSTTPPAPAPVNTTDSNAEAAASDLAEQFIPTWLTAHRGQEQEMQRFVDFDADAVSPGLPDKALYTASHPILAGITPAPMRGGKAYAVTVSVDVAPTTGATTVRRYYQVPVAVSASGVKAMSLPHSTPAPSTGVSVNNDYEADLASNTPIVDAAHGFLDAMLAGDGDITRFISPGANIGAVTPPPYASVDIQSAKADVDVGPEAPPDGRQAHVLLNVSQKPTGGSSNDELAGTYALTMTARAGRWEVSTLDPAPQASLSSSSGGSSLSGDSNSSDTSSGGSGSDSSSGSTGSDSSSGGSDSTGTGQASPTPSDSSDSDTGSGTSGGPGGGSGTSDMPLLPKAARAPYAPVPGAPSGGNQGAAPAPSAAPPANTNNSGSSGSLLAPGGSDLGPPR